MVQKIKTFLGESIWNIRVSELSKSKGRLLTLARIAILTCRLFLKNQCSLRASALTFYTLLSVVPVAALIFGIGRSFGYDDQLKEKLRMSLVGHEAVATKIIGFADSMIQNTSRGLLAGIGVLLLIWTALKLLANIEQSFNDIWGIKSGRPWSRKISDYLTMLIICPLLILLVGSETILLSNKAAAIISALPFSDTINEFISLGSRAIPFIAAWLIFTFIYIFMPNTKVRLSAAFPAGFCVGTCYLVIQSAYIYAQALLTGYNAIYGSFAALPFFLIWLQVSWTLTLFGAQLAFSIQNVNFYELAPGDGKLSPKQESVFALKILKMLVEAFKHHKGALSDVQISQELEIPIRMTRAVIYELVDVKILTEIKTEKWEDASYQIAVPPEELTPVYVLRALSDRGSYLRETNDGPHYEQVLNKLWEDAAKSTNNRPL